MLKYVFERVLAMLVTLAIIVTMGFMVIRLMPGSMFEGNPDMSPEQLAALEAKYHLDKPLLVQYGYPNVPVWEILQTRIPISMYINVYSLLISLPIGVILGIVAAIKKNTWVDYTVSFLVVVCISVPSFVFATLMQYFFAFKMEAFPIIYEPTAVGMAKLYSLALPIMALALSPIARVARYLRAELAETINSDFMLLAKTKGLTERQATINHGIRNSLLPLMNIIVPMFTNILGGSLVIETIFAIPGMGGMMVNSINAPDYEVTLAILIFYSIIPLGTILLVDISYGIIDPRIRMGGKK